jgi:hypothetical protein
MLDKQRERLLRKSRTQGRKVRADCILLMNTAQFVAESHPGDEPWLTPERRAELARDIAHLDQALAVIDGILSGQLPEDTLVPV